MEHSKFKGFLKGVNHLSLGISMVVAVIMGVGIGIGLKTWLGYDWLLFVGIFWGVAAAFLNVYKAHVQHQKDFEIYEKEQKILDETFHSHDLKR